jgi:hypothetical protein
MNKVYGTSISDSHIFSLWACNDGEKIEKDDLDNPNKDSNSAWDGTRVRIFGGRNEIIAFQLIVQAGSAGIDSLDVSLRELDQRGGSASIKYSSPEKDPTLYTGRPIQLFSVNYMNVTIKSYSDWTYPQGKASEPKKPLGWKPVQLIPENAAAGRGGFPLKVEPSMNQGIWTEIYTGRDLPAGFYDGTITVKADGEVREIPIELELFDFVLPDDNSMHAMLYYESRQPVIYHGKKLDDVYHRFAHRQRVEFVQRYNEKTASENMGRLDGSDFTKDKGYEGPGENKGLNIVPRSFYGPGSEFDTKESVRTNSDSWIEFLNKNLPGKITFLYMPDEPRQDKYDYIHSISENIHKNPGPGRNLKVFVTHHYTPELDGRDNAINIWDCLPDYYDSERAELERAHGDDIWIYNGVRPNSGCAAALDVPATDPRSIIWACFKGGIKVYFYWHSCNWYHNEQLPSRFDKNQDVWSEPITFRNQYEEYINGEGVLMYPGEEILHPEQDRGIEGPCSTIQLANFRRGLQDHLYLTMAQELGFADEVASALESIVPKVFLEVDNSDKNAPVSFPEDGNTYEKVRYSLARVITAKTKKHS